MPRIILPIALILCLIACNNSIKTTQTQQFEFEYPVDSITIDKVQIYSDTLQYLADSDDDNHLYGLFLNKDMDTLQIILGEALSLSEDDENKMFFAKWRDENKETEYNNLYMIQYQQIDTKLFRTCREYSLDEGYTTVYECIYPDKNLQQVYDLVKSTDNQLLRRLPAENIEYGDDLNVRVSYQYHTKKHLVIELNYPGGITIVEIIERKNNTMSNITFSAD